MPSRISENNTKIHLKAGGLWAADWFCVDQDSSKFQAVVDMVMKFRVPQNSGIISTRWGPLVCQEEFNSMKLFSFISKLKMRAYMSSN
jgi:hypothetical protein